MSNKRKLQQDINCLTSKRQLPIGLHSQRQEQESESSNEFSQNLFQSHLQYQIKQQQELIQRQQELIQQQQSQLQSHKQQAQPKHQQDKSSQLQQHQQCKLEMMKAYLLQQRNHQQTTKQQQLPIPMSQLQQQSHP
jgi:hypothetical protein